MLCEVVCDAGKQINCLKLLEIWDFGLALASRQGLPVLKRTIWCVFCLVFPALLDFVLGGEVARGRVSFILFGTHKSNPNPAPCAQTTKNSDANCDAGRPNYLPVSYLFSLNSSSSGIKTCCNSG